MNHGHDACTPLAATASHATTTREAEPASSSSATAPAAASTPIAFEVVMSATPKLPKATVSDADCWK
ncbi:MAG: hypothetical protein ACHREM_16960 [Polyangiales bacterium]